MPPEARGISITFSSARAFESKARVFIPSGSVPEVIIGPSGRFCDSRDRIGMRGTALTRMRLGTQHPTRTRRNVQC